MAANYSYLVKKVGSENTWQYLNADFAIATSMADKATYSAESIVSDSNLNSVFALYLPGNVEIVGNYDLQLSGTLTDEQV